MGLSEKAPAWIATERYKQMSVSKASSGDAPKTEAHISNSDRLWGEGRKHGPHFLDAVLVSPS